MDQRPNWQRTALGRTRDMKKSLGRYSLVAALLVGSFIGGAVAQHNYGTISGYLATISNKTGAYTLNASLGGDCGIELVVTVSTTQAVTLPNNGVVGCQVSIVQGGSAKVTLAAASGATLNSPHAFTGTYQTWSVITAQVIANSNGSSAVWLFGGDGS
jgi:hypothetical protein